MRVSFFIFLSMYRLICNALLRLLLPALYAQRAQERSYAVAKTHSGGRHTLHIALVRRTRSLCTVEEGTRGILEHIVSTNLYRRSVFCKCLSVSTNLNTNDLLPTCSTNSGHNFLKLGCSTWYSFQSIATIPGRPIDLIIANDPRMQTV